MKILKLFLITCGYLALLAPYCYGTTPSIATSQSTPPDGEAMLSQVSRTPGLVMLCQLIQQGGAYHNQKNYLTAIVYYKSALQKYGQIYNQKSILLAMIYHKLGVSCLELKAYPESHAYFQQSLTIRQAFLSMDISATACKPISEVTGETHHYLGRLYLAIDNPKAAILSFTAALNTEWQHHLAAIQTEYYLARAYQLEKHYQKSLNLYKAILAKQERFPYLKSEEVANVIKWLSQVTKEIAAKKKEREVVNQLINIGHTSTAQQRDTIWPVVRSGMSETLSLPPALPQDQHHGHTINTEARNTRIARPRHHLTHTQQPLPSSRAKRQTCRTEATPTRTLRSQQGKKSFPCPTCGRKFTLKSNMKTHLRRHTGEKPFACPVCQKKFVQKQEMKSHLLTHTKEKPFQCPVCQKGFSLKHNMTVHLRIHAGTKPFVCPVCQKSFAQKQQMQVHMRLHNNEKPFSCPLCSKSFTRKQQMQVHMRVHTGEKPFACPICQRGFAIKQHMKRHMNVHN